MPREIIFDCMLAIDDSEDSVEARKLITEAGLHPTILEKGIDFKDVDEETILPLVAGSAGGYQTLEGVKSFITVTKL